MLKLCANHRISVEQELKPLANETRAWCWFAQDYSEEEIKQEQLAVRFKNADLAAHFKQVFEECQEELKQATAIKEAVAAVSPTPAVKPEAPAKPKESLADLFKGKSQNKWTCDACYVTNDDSAKKCLACETLRPGVEPDPEPTSQAGDSTPKFAFGAQGGFTFGGGAGKSFGSFGAPAPAAAPAAPQAPAASSSSAATTAAGGAFVQASKPATAFGSTPGFQFGSTPSSSSTSGGFKFGSSPAVSASATSAKDSAATPKVTQAAPAASKSTEGSKPVVSFNFKSLTPPPKPAASGSTMVKSPQTPQSPEGDGYYMNKEGEDEHITFEPVVKLPDKVDIITGEEEEEELYKHRAKLYRFINGEWKERGVGDIKLLKNPQTGRVRAVMRRDQVLKICLNHYLTPEMELNPMPNAQGKAWTWHADDFTDGEATHENLAIRFKNEDMAQDFKATFDGARDMIKQTSSTSAKNEEPQPATEEDKSDTKPDSKGVSFTSGFTSLKPSLTQGSSFSFKPSSPADQKNEDKNTAEASKDTTGFQFKLGASTLASTSTKPSTSTATAASSPSQSIASTDTKPGAGKDGFSFKLGTSTLATASTTPTTSSTPGTSFTFQQSAKPVFGSSSPFGGGTSTGSVFGGATTPQAPAGSENTGGFKFGSTTFGSGGESGTFKFGGMTTKTPSAPIATSLPAFGTAAPKTPSTASHKSPLGKSGGQRSMLEELLMTGEGQLYMLTVRGRMLCDIFLNAWSTAQWPLQYLCPSS